MFGAKCQQLSGGLCSQSCVFNFVVCLVTNHGQLLDIRLPFLM
jgi:hypothetical protein